MKEKTTFRFNINIINYADVRILLFTKFIKSRNKITKMNLH